MVIEDLIQIAPLSEWLLGPGWYNGWLWSRWGIPVLVVLLLSGGLALVWALRRGTGRPGPALSTSVGGILGGLTLLVLAALAMCSTDITRHIFSQRVTQPVFDHLTPILGEEKPQVDAGASGSPDKPQELKNWTSGALYTWLAASFGLFGVVYFVSWLVCILISGPARGTQQCGRAVVEIAADIARLSPRRTFALSWLAFRESLRRRVVWVFVAFVAFILIAALFMRKDSQHPSQLYITVVMNCTIYLTVLFALILSALSLPADIRDRTLTTVVTKPVRKLEIVLGRVLGFTAVGTLLLAAIGIISYVFVVRSVDHTHKLTPDSLQKVMLPDNGYQLVGDTELKNGHTHRVTITFNEKGERTGWTVETKHDHTHELKFEEKNGQTFYKLGPPEGQFRARVPIYGKLTFTDKTGKLKNQEKNINVGDEWSYRSFIQGRTAAEATWVFSNLSEEMFPPDEFPQGIPIEMTIEVFRTHKGNMEKGVPGTIWLSNPKTGKKVKLEDFAAEKFATDIHMIPLHFSREASDGKIERIHLFSHYKLEKDAIDALGRAGLPGDVLSRLEQRLQEKDFDWRSEFVSNLAEILGPEETRKFGDQITKAAEQPGDLVSDGKLAVSLQCLEFGQCFGMAQPDMYIRAADSNFEWNFFKGYFGIWMEMVLVVSLGVVCSTFVSGSVALLLTIFIMIAGFFSSFIAEIGTGTMVGGGPMESAYRIGTRDNMINQMEPGLRTNTIKAVDQAISLGMRYFSAVVPEVNDNFFGRYLAFGFNIGPDLLGRCILRELGFVLPVLLLGFICLRQREVAQ